MGDVSEHFSRREFACHHCGRIHIAPQLVTMLEAARRRVRKPLRIVSGYRCPVHNREVGGAKSSQHLRGTAADVPAGYAPVGVWIDAGARGIGVDRQGRVIHVDVRQSARSVVFHDGW